MTSNKYTILIASFAALIIVVAGLGIVFNISVRNIESNQVQAKSNIVVTGPSPVISSVGGNPNPSIDSQTVQLSASVDFGTLIHGIAWYVNGTLIASYNSGPYGKNPVPTTLDHTFTSVGSFLVTVEASNAYGSSNKSFTENVVIGPEPIITSVNSSAIPSYVGQNVSFDTSVNWEGYSGSLSYFVNGSQIIGSSYIFKKSGNYNVTVEAMDTDGNSSSATYVQQVNPFDILGVSLMTNSTNINTTSAYNNSKIGPNGPGPFNSSLTDLTEYTLTGANTSLAVSSGTYNNTPSIIFNFTMTNRTWNVSIVYTLLLNKTTNQYMGLLSADISPASRPIRLGNDYVIDYSSTVVKQLTGVENGIKLTSNNYSNSQNSNLVTLASYYKNLTIAFDSFIGMIPSNLSTISVMGTQAQITDYSWTCILDIIVLLGDLFLFAIDIIGFIIAPEISPFDAWFFFLEVNFMLPVDIGSVLYDC